MSQQSVPIQAQLSVQSQQAPPQQVTLQEQELSNATAETWLTIGSLAEALGDVDRAAAAYDSSLRHSPNSSRALTSLANLYRTRDMFAKAAELYQRALSITPDAGETWGLLGHCYLMLDDLQRAYAAYQQALYHLNNPNVPKLWHGIGILYDRYGSLEYAEEAFRRVLELDPNFEKANEIYFRLGIIYKHESKLSQALECFRYILANPPSPLTQADIWFQIGAVLEQQRDYIGAKDAYQKVLQSNPKHAKVLQQLGCLYAQPGSTFTDPSVAIALLSQSLEIDSTDAHTWYHIGRVHMSRADYTAAYDAFQQAVNRDSRNPTFWCSIGVLYYQISQYRDALDAYTRAIRLNPYISEVWYDLGTLYETCNNQISDALDAYKQAVTLDPNNPHIQARLEQLTKYQKEGGANGSLPPPPPPSQQPRLSENIISEHQQGYPQAGQLGQHHLQAGQPIQALQQPPPLQAQLPQYQQLPSSQQQQQQLPSQQQQHHQQQQYQQQYNQQNQQHTQPLSTGRVETKPRREVTTTKQSEEQQASEQEHIIQPRSQDRQSETPKVNVQETKPIPQKRELKDGKDSITKKRNNNTKLVGETVIGAKYAEARNTESKSTESGADEANSIESKAVDQQLEAKGQDSTKVQRSDRAEESLITATEVTPAETESTSKAKVTPEPLREERSTVPNGEKKSDEPKIQELLPQKEKENVGQEQRSTVFSESKGTNGVSAINGEKEPTIKPTEETISLLKEDEEKKDEEEKKAESNVEESVAKAREIKEDENYDDEE
ncbi:hypothetical protein WICMUC_002434 [Wickerhamomyces mucosus]|uniref:Uncharacterized protein n=1 Tax=Wickerhamomyces mucosus TaxID=1378264 RepID=A0A9P8PQW1_9ASCO|nr:hypothetical protein WICMUC_002434 [Wickerhamomyces mucosus]